MLSSASCSQYGLRFCVSVSWLLTMFSDHVEATLGSFPVINNKYLTTFVINLSVDFNRNSNSSLFFLLSLVPPARRFIICTKHYVRYLKGALSGLRPFLATEISLKMMKNTFLFHLQSSFFLSRYLNFCLDFLAMQKNSLIRKIRFISKSMKSQPG